ncbi:MAG: AMP-binding protein [Mycobacteriales bacterium]
MLDATDFQLAGQDIPWLLEHWAEHKPDHPVLVWEPREGAGRTWTYREFLHDVRRLAAGLHARGIGKGDKVLIHSDNCPEMVLAWYACAVLGAVGVTTNTRSVEAEVAYFVDKAGCVAAVTQSQYADLVRAAAPSLSWIALTDDLEDLYGEASACPSRPAEPMLPVGILFTSGTTSKPKAVVHTHANAIWAGRVGPRNIDLSGDDIYLVYLPFFHVNAQSWSMWAVLGVGATVVLQPKWSTSAFWDVVVRQGVTHISLMPFVFTALAGQDKPASQLRVGVFGLIVPELEAWLGIRVYAAYGMTETVTHAIHGRPQELWPAKSMGHPTPGYEIAVVDKETGELCAPEQVGELWVRGTRGIQLFLEYFDNPEANAKSFTEDGWFRTGDMVRVGAGGNVFYCDRDSDLIKVGGENVSAREVEDTCRTVPGVADVAVVGKKHEWLDAVVVAYVVKAPGAPDDSTFEKQVIEACAAALADFKVPRAVYVVDDFPRATLEKVAKNVLREMADAEPPV